MRILSSRKYLILFLTFLIVTVQPLSAVEPTPTPAKYEIEIKLKVKTSKVIPGKTRINLIGFPDASNATIESVVTVLEAVPVLRLNDKKQPVVGLSGKQQEQLDKFFVNGGALVSYKIAR